MMNSRYMAAVILAATVIVPCCLGSSNHSMASSSLGPGAQQGLQASDSMFITNATALPCKPAPPLWANPRTLSSGNWSIQTDPETNATRVVIKHAPIAGVTPQMMQWVFRNMDKMVVDPRSSRGKPEHHQMFVLLHPVDNVALKYSDPVLRMNATDPIQGTAWHFAHFYAALCNMTYLGAKKPWVTCPSSRRAFSCNTPQQKLAATLSTNTTSYYAQRLDESAFAAAVTLGGFVVSKVVYNWQEASSGLEITQELVFGLEEPWAASLNPQGLQDTMGRATKGDAQLGLAALVLHEIEIVGWYPQWLPAVYKAARQSETVTSNRKLRP